MKMQLVAEGIYKYVGARKTSYYERVRVDGKNTDKRLLATTIAEAKAARAKRLAAHAKSKEDGEVESPYVKTRARRGKVHVARYAGILRDRAPV